MIFNQFNASCFIFTFKDGLLSILAHDLKLKCSHFKITIECSPQDPSLWQQVSATFDTTSIKTVCALKNGQENLTILSKQDYVDIERNIANDVLNLKKFLSINFKSDNISNSPDGFIIKGQLTICNVTRKINIPVKRSKDKYLIKMILDQTDFHIKPFSALMNTMKVKPKIIVKIEMNGLFKPFQ